MKLTLDNFKDLVEFMKINSLAFCDEDLNIVDDNIVEELYFSAIVKE